MNTWLTWWSIAATPLDFNGGIRERLGHHSRAGPALRFALIKHDAAIGVTLLRQLLNRTGDLLTALIILPLLAMATRRWLSGLSDVPREIVAFGVSSLIVFALATGLLKRVSFHQTEGVLAHFAQRSDEWLSYALPFFAAGLFVGLAGMAVIDILDPVGTALGVCMGVAAGLAIPFVRVPLDRGWRNLAQRTKRTPRRYQHMLMIGAVVSALIGAICAFLPQNNGLDALVTVGYGLAIILLTGRVDVAIVHYLTLVSPSSISLLRYWLPIQLVLLLPFASVLLISQSWAPAGLAALFALGLPAITAMRIFAYRAFNRLIADWIVSFLILSAGYAAFTFPPLGLAVIIAEIIWLARRGSGTRWLLT